MRSQQIKVINLPETKESLPAVRVKPIFFLCLFMALGFYLIFSDSDLTAAGVMLLIMPVFALFVLPDRTLVEFSPKYMVMYNSRDREMCTLIYWEDIVSWQYERARMVDHLVVNLVDGSTCSVDMYSKGRISGWMDRYAQHKEIKARRKEGS
ncbi:MAG: hypothetical protein IKF51_06360 [Solobacterium sp.]|nr:hypothetical protein [Solobacterium sp.]